MDSGAGLSSRLTLAFDVSRPFWLKSTEVSEGWNLFKSKVVLSLPENPDLMEKASVLFVKIT